ncbi:Uncharacterized protein FWK35_00015630 [Aphis craccivora]|uniref:Uncharacterized protein n=1 Tax=Aphis craccivora TaxID=307492 RepID=A0A6G0Y5F2_APHCR|nr:Uncharacterized protein FWK35_00015630 [Aphis craccivora]
MIPTPLIHYLVSETLGIIIEQIKKKKITHQTINKLRNVKKTIAKWSYPKNASKREQIIIDRARIGHSNITRSYLITKEPKQILRLMQHPPLRSNT